MPDLMDSSTNFPISAIASHFGEPPSCLLGLYTHKNRIDLSPYDLGSVIFWLGIATAGALPAP
jgi:hypothetical protein